jgi:hypothetical protein
MSWQTPLFSTFGVFVCIEFIASFRMLLKYKDSPLIVNRSLTSVLIQVSSQAVGGIVGCFKLAFGGTVNCGATTLFQFYSVFVKLTFIVERCLLLLFNFYAAVQAQELAKNHFEEKEEGRIKWVLSKRHYFHFGPWSVSKRFAYGLTFLELLVPLIQIIVDPKKRGQSMANSQECAELVTDIMPFNNALFLFALITLMECGRRISKIKENFYIKQEFRNMVILGVIVIPWLATSYIPSISAYSQSDVAYYIVFPIMEIFISAINVALVAKREKERQNHVTSSPGPSDETNSKQMDTIVSANQNEKKRKADKERLYEIMHNEVTKGAFEKFMVQEFSVENIYFLLAVENFERHAALPHDESTSKKLRSLAQDIWDRFCDANSNLSVNISFKARNDVSDKLKMDINELPRPDLFEKAKLEIITLICQDPLRRFLRSELYTKAESLEVPTQVTVAV